MTLGGDRARGDRWPTVQINRVRDAADMPELKEDAATPGVNGSGDLLPTGHLLRRPNSRGVWVADSHGSDRRRLG